MKLSIVLLVLLVAGCGKVQDHEARRESYQYHRLAHHLQYHVIHLGNCSPRTVERAFEVAGPGWTLMLPECNQLILEPIRINRPGVHLRGAYVPADMHDLSAWRSRFLALGSGPLINIGKNVHDSEISGLSFEWIGFAQPKLAEIRQTLD